ncbi:MAG: helix-turn-helix domain-containing protein [Bacterioplanes sp.]|nr:helix-turn-helix domain-containing protein [Bacterioplanes sp.]
MREKQALTTGEVAKYCGVNFRTVIRWIERGHLEAYKLPGRGDNRIPIASFVEFLNGNNMPIPEELQWGGRVLLLLVDDTQLAADVAAAARRQGWDVLMTSDPIQFGFYIASRQPAALAVNQAVSQASVERLLRDSDQRDVQCFSFITTEQDGHRDGWLTVTWPEQQATFSQLLTQESA